MATVTVTLAMGAAEIELDITGSVEFYRFHGAWASSPEHADVFIDEIASSRTGRKVANRFLNLLTAAHYAEINEALIEEYM